MVIIRLPSGAEWYKANWVFRKLVSDFSKTYPTDTDLIAELERAEAFGMLDFQQLDHALALRLLHAMKSAVTNVLASDASVADSDETSRMYKESITELAQMMR